MLGLPHACVHDHWAGYAIAATLGFSLDDLMTFTRNAVAASFTTATRRAALFGELHP